MTLKRCKVLETMGTGRPRPHSHRLVLQGGHGPSSDSQGQNPLLYGAFYTNLFERHHGLRPETWDCLVGVTADRRAGPLERGLHVGLHELRAVGPDP